MLSSFFTVFFSRLYFYLKFQETNCKAYPKLKSRLKFQEMAYKNLKNKTKDLVILKVCGQCFLF